MNFPIDLSLNNEDDIVNRSEERTTVPPPPPPSKYKLRSKTNNCHEVLFGGDETRGKHLTKMILQYLI